MSERDDRAYQDGASGGMFTGSSAGEYAAFMAGQATRPRPSGPPMPPGATVGFLLILFAPLVWLVVGALYPMAGLLMLGSLIVILELMQGIGGIVIYLVMLVWLFMAAAIAEMAFVGRSAFMACSMVLFCTWAITTLSARSVSDTCTAKAT